MIYWLALLSLLITTPGLAKNNFPASCKPILIKKESFLVGDSKPQLILINNRAKTDIWITHPVEDPSTSAGWSTRLEPEKWAALTVDKPSFELTCIESTPGHEQQIPCINTVAACQWPTLPSSQKNVGTLWAAENLSLSNLLERLGLPSQ